MVRMTCLDCDVGEKEAEMGERTMQTKGYCSDRRSSQLPTVARLVESKR